LRQKSLFHNVLSDFGISFQSVVFRIQRARFPFHNSCSGLFQYGGDPVKDTVVSLIQFIQIIHKALSVFIKTNVAS
jgi:hypothetical protein